MAFSYPSSNNYSAGWKNLTFRLTRSGLTVDSTTIFLEVILKCFLLQMTLKNTNFEVATILKHIAQVKPNYHATHCHHSRKKSSSVFLIAYKKTLAPNSHWPEKSLNTSLKFLSIADSINVLDKAKKTSKQKKKFLLSSNYKHSSFKSNFICTKWFMI